MPAQIVPKRLANAQFPAGASAGAATSADPSAPECDHRNREPPHYAIVRPGFARARRPPRHRSRPRRGRRRPRPYRADLQVRGGGARSCRPSDLRPLRRRLHPRPLARAAGDEAARGRHRLDQPLRPVARPHPADRRLQGLGPRQGSRPRGLSCQPSLQERADRHPRGSTHEDPPDRCDPRRRDRCPRDRRRPRGCLRERGAARGHALRLVLRDLPRHRRDDARRRDRDPARLRRDLPRRGRLARQGARLRLAARPPAADPQGLRAVRKHPPPPPAAGRRGPAAQSSDFDILCVRENTEGEYSGAGGRVHVGTPDEVASRPRSSPGQASSASCASASSRRGGGGASSPR